MGENGEASSSAAHGAHQEDDSKRGLLTRWLSALGGQTDRDEADHPTAMVPVGDAPSGGLANLTRLRVEDVMIPKVEVVAVATDIKKDELVEVFRASGLTRLPVARLLMLLRGLLTLGPAVIVHLLTLPPEFDASFNRALPVLQEQGVLYESDERHARKLLKAAAMTYVSASLMSLLNIARWWAILRR